MTDLCVQKANQILTLGQPPQNLFNLGQFEVCITFTSLTWLSRIILQYIEILIIEFED
jgi:hypothetical protein